MGSPRGQGLCLLPGAVGISISPAPSSPRRSRGRAELSTQRWSHVWVPRGFRVPLAEPGHPGLSWVLPGVSASVSTTDPPAGGLMPSPAPRLSLPPLPHGMSLGTPGLSFTPAGHPQHPSAPGQDAAAGNKLKQQAEAPSRGTEPAPSGARPARSTLQEPGWGGAGGGSLTWGTGRERPDRIHCPEPELGPGTPCPEPGAGRFLSGLGFVQAS